MPDKDPTPAERHAAKIEEFKTQFGDYGDPVPGSRYVRWYCGGCGDPIRVTAEQANGDTEIPDCPKCRANLHAGGGSGSYNADPDCNGTWSNVVKELDGGQ